MLHNTQAVVLHTIRYGETSLIVTAFTGLFGVQSYLVQGIRQASAKGRSSRAGLLQPGTILDLTVYHKPGKNLQRIREFSAAYFYQSIQESVIKNSIALFSVELLYRLLPEDAAIPDLFDFTVEYLQALDRHPVSDTGNFPVWFALQCARALGFTLQGSYSDDTPYLSLPEGGFTDVPPPLGSTVTVMDSAMLSRIMRAQSVQDVAAVPLDSHARHRLLEWWLQYLHRHTDHMKPVKSLRILQEVLR